MEYRTVPRSGQKVSVIGLGMGSIHAADTREVEETVRLALDAGVNLFDFIPSEAAPFEGYARALKGRRDQALMQVHLGADYSNRKYGWTTDAALAISQFEERLRTLGTDYADFGFIHCIDEDADFDQVMNGGIWDYACRMKKEGVIRHLAFSTHDVGVARRFLATGAMDWGMFSLNPLYDYTDASDYGKGEADDRARLYREFEAAGVGISVMKAFAGSCWTRRRRRSDARSPRRSASSTRSTSPAWHRCCPTCAASRTCWTCWRTSTPPPRSATTPCWASSRRPQPRGRACTATTASRARAASR